MEKEKKSRPKTAFTYLSRYSVDECVQRLKYREEDQRRSFMSRGIKNPLNLYVVTVNEDMIRFYLSSGGFFAVKFIGIIEKSGEETRITGNISIIEFLMYQFGVAFIACLGFSLVTLKPLIAIGLALVLLPTFLIPMILYYRNWLIGVLEDALDATRVQA